jgi:hypothetical protein
VKRSADETELVPPAPTTVTSIWPADSGGEVTSRLEGVRTKMMARVVPKKTVSPTTYPEPAIVTVVPPAIGPDEGLTPETTGTGTTNVTVGVAGNTMDVVVSVTVNVTASADRSVTVNVVCPFVPVVDVA